MDQQWLAKHVLSELTKIPATPAKGRYLPLEQAEAIVDETIAHVGRYGDSVEYKYLVGHRHRLAISLTMVPLAETTDSTCLDVGCFGYMAFWAWRHLGYSRVEGIELRPDIRDPVIMRSLEVGGQQFELTTYNFDISLADWPLQQTYDTVLFFETLEHVNSDPMAIMLNVARRMCSDSTLVMSVPNAVSYKTLQEFLTGAPPWTYWFFHPDLRHEPRHCFEYTPIFLKILLYSSGFVETAFRTICAYADRNTLDDIFEIGSALSIDAHFFGETMIAQAHKTSETALIRYPDCIYDSELYYRSTYPVLEPVLRNAMRAFLEGRRGQSRQLTEAEARANEATIRADEAVARMNESNVRANQAEARVIEALFVCDRYLAREDELQEALRAEQARASAAEALNEAMIRSTSWRMTDPIRRLSGRFPRITSRTRAVVAPLYRLLRSGRPHARPAA